MFVGVVIVVVIALVLSLGCINARRRRRRGLSPRYGTGWMGGKYSYNANPNNGGYNPGGYNPGGAAAAPPQYSQNPQNNPQNPQYTGNTFNSNEGYYGQQHDGIQLQQPNSTYYPRGGVDNNDGYTPPPGPPPSKVA